MASDRDIPIARPATGDEEWAAARACFESGWLTQGPRVAEFERAFAAHCGARHAIAVSSGTTALHLMLAALGIGPGDEVIIPAFTWVATANVVVHCGATPVLVDVDGTTFNIDPARIAAAVTPRTRALMPVHQFGLCADWDATAAAAPGIPLLEDAACAAGAEYRGRRAGTLGVAAAFSFHPRKVMTTGEGGMLTTDDDRFAERALALRSHGAPDFELAGYNYRLSDPQAAVGLVQLAKLDAFLAERDQLAARYDHALAAIPWLRPTAVPADRRHGRQAYVCMVDPARAPLARDQIIEALAARGIATRSGTHAVHMLPYYRERFALRPDDLPRARDCHDHSLALPLYNRMTEAEQDRVVQALSALG
jgi:dTDP-4-amino-4,6-dideoxygalactose transaminase